MQGWIVEVHGWLNEMIELHCVVEAGEVCKTRDRVYSLMLANLRLEHASDCYRKAIPVRPGMVPRHIFVQTQLPLVQVVLAVAVPKPVKAGSECNRAFDAFTLRDHHDVGVSQLKR